MKTSLLMLLLAGIVVFPAAAQKKVDKMVAYTQGKTIFLNLKFASTIKISTWQKNEISVSVSVNINNNVDNDEFKLENSESATEIQIKSDIPNMKNIARTQTTTSGTHSYYGNNGYWDKDNKVYVNSGKQVLADLNYEIFVPETANLRLKTIDGNIKMTALAGKCEIESISGNIDLTVPLSQKCNFSLKTITGDIYSNLPLQIQEEFKKDNLDLVGGGHFNQNIEAKLNGGGSEIRLKTISSNIYVRKK